APGHVLELGELAVEGQPGDAGGPVAVLGHDDLGHAPVGRLRVVELISIDEHHDVTVLLNTSRFPQIGQYGTLVGPHLQVAGQLRQSDDRDLQLAGQDLQAAAHLRHLDLAVLGAGTPAHQLQVVDDDHPERTQAALQSPGLGPDLHDREV